MLGRLRDGCRRPAFHHQAAVEDDNTLRQELDHRDVVGDEQVAQAKLVAEVGQEVEHLGLGGEIQGTDGLIAHHELRFADQGTGDGDPLALAAGELAGVAVHGLTGQPHAFEHGFGFFARHCGGNPADPQRLRQRSTDALARVQRGVGVLEDRPQFTAEGAALCSTGMGDVLALVADGAAGALLEAKDRLADGGFSGAGFPHQAYGLAGTDGEADAVHRCRGCCSFPAAAVPDQQVLDLQHGLLRRNWRRVLPFCRLDAHARSFSTIFSTR